MSSSLDAEKIDPKQFFSFPYDPFSLLIVKKLKINPYIAALLLLATLYLPILFFLQRHAVWGAACVRYRLCGSDMFHDSFWVGSNLVFIIPSILLFFSLPVWIENGIRRELAAIAKDRHSCHADLLERSEQIVKKLISANWSGVFGWFPGINFAFYTNQFGTSWHDTTKMLPYFCFFWTVIFTIAIINISRFLVCRKIISDLKNCPSDTFRKE